MSFHPKDKLEIPRSSFTAFRLTYQSAQNISETSKCTLLGRIPNLWFHDGKVPGVLKGASHHAKGKVKKKFKSTVTTMNRSIRSSSSYKVGNDNVELGPEGGFNLFHKQTKLNIHDLLQEYAQNELETQDNATETEVEADQDLISAAKYSTDSSSESFFEAYDPLTEVTTPIKSSFYTPREDIQAQEENCINCDLGDGKIYKHQIKDRTDLPSFEISTDGESVVLGDGLTLNTIHNDNGKASPSVTFDPVALHKPSKGRMEIAIPQPCEVTSEEIHQAQREKHRLRKKIKNFTKGSSRTTNKKKNDIRLKIYRMIWKKFQAGEIMRVDRMLVLIKEARHTTNISQFGETEPCDSRVYERWKEYLVVLKKTDDVTEPLAVQLFDIHTTTSDTKARPDFAFNVSLDVKSHFYSGLDKSICLTVPKENGSMIYIMKCNNQVTSFKWLYFVEQMLGREFDSSFRISIPGLHFSVIIKVPESVIFELLNSNDTLNVIELEHGYEVEYSCMVEYLKQCVLKELENKNNFASVSEWFLKNTNPWFCFKQYDRLEWIINNSSLFFIQNQLLSRSFQLEFRNRGHHVRETMIKEQTLKEPIPIEGFLCRLNNISGNEKNLFGTYHKVSYFYSCDDILFFTRFFRGSPPSPGNILLNNDVATPEITEITPHVYEHNPFPLDDNDHITWLNGNEFEKYDHDALMELERRTQQIIKAEALIDICSIVHVRAVSLNRNKKTHNMLLCLVWYSAPNLVNDTSIVDSVFEIEMKNGSIIKLQAPCRDTRDEWVTRLLELKDYWVSRKSKDLETQIETRIRNEQALKINEYIDSNIVQEGNNIKAFSTYADPSIHNIDCIAMTKCVLMSGYLYQKLKKHSNFNQYFVVLCPGFLLLFSLFKRSKRTGSWKKNPYFEHYLTIPISDCYVYSGHTTSLDLLDRQQDFNSMNPGHHSLPRIYTDGWKSTEEEPLRCFTLWFGKKRKIVGKDKASEKYNLNTLNDDKPTKNIQKNPGLVKMVSKLGITGRSIVFMTRSRQEREIWVNRIFAEVDRFAKNN